MASGARVRTGESCFGKVDNSRVIIEIKGVTVNDITHVECHIHCKILASKFKINYKLIYVFSLSLFIIFLHIAVKESLSLSLSLSLYLSLSLSLSCTLYISL